MNKKYVVFKRSCGLDNEYLTSVKPSSFEGKNPADGIKVTWKQAIKLCRDWNKEARDCGTSTIYGYYAIE